MPISALLLTLRPGASAPPRLADPRVIVGDLQGLWLPVVTATASLGEAEDLVEHLQRHPDIEQVELVSVDFSDLEDAGCADASS